MGFIEADQTVISIKLTDKGRDLLSRGQLTFDQYAVGDSEIDYNFYDKIGFDAFNATILRPKDNNPNIISFITKEVSGVTHNSLGSVVSNTSLITNTATERGFFTKTGTTYNLLSEANIAKQPHLAIPLSGVAGGTTLSLKQSALYGSNPTEPVVGDYFVVKWGNPDLGDTVGFAVNQSIPYIWYKIESITSGTLNADTLIVVVDKPLPDFNGSGGSSSAGALLYSHSNGRDVSGDSVQNYYGSPYVTDFASEALLSFLENYDTPTIDVPIWNMTIIFTKDVEGVQTTGRSMSQYYSKKYTGFINYIERIAPTVERIGLIHYTNNSPSNNYGEGLVQNTQVLEIPTVMWHKNSGSTKIGLTLTASTTVLTLSGLNTTYQTLVDSFGNIVGKVFNDLQIFVIEDQELLYAMSYKSNRNWTLPPISSGFNIVNC
jgi:hypothetical protein